MPIDEVWHRRNRMPRNATMTQRIDWHREHAKHCGCRPIQATVLDQIENKRGGEEPK